MTDEKQQGAFSDDAIRQAGRTLARTYFREAKEPEVVLFDEPALADAFARALDAMSRAVRRAVDDYNAQKPGESRGSIQ